MWYSAGAETVQPQSKASSTTHVIRIVLTLVCVAVCLAVLRPFLLPDEFGKFGHYRPGAVEDEAARVARHMNSESCFECHPLMKKLHVDGVHKTVSCEICHGAYADHIENDAVVASMPVIRGEDIKPLCIRCHNKIIQARPPEAVKMVAMPEHLEELKVRTHHGCDQCHHVHAPMKWVHEARTMMGLPLEKEGR